MTEYRVFSSKDGVVDCMDARDFAMFIANYLACGWEPCGGVSAVSEQGGTVTVLYQAMIRKEQR